MDDNPRVKYLRGQILKIEEELDEAYEVASFGEEIKLELYDKVELKLLDTFMRAKEIKQLLKRKDYIYSLIINGVQVFLRDRKKYGC